MAYYPFDETTGTVVNDRSGKGNHAAIVNSNAGTVWSNGRGLKLRAATAGRPAVRLPDSLLAGLSNVTIAFDVRLSSATSRGRSSRSAGRRTTPAISPRHRAPAPPVTRRRSRARARARWRRP